MKYGNNEFYIEKHHAKMHTNTSSLLTSLIYADNKSLFYELTQI